jgi:spermidine synthase
VSIRLTPRHVAPLLFGSGFCSLVYQVGWLREFRLVFGASTAASAAVLAIFVGGLGLGSLLLGRRADAAKSPLAFYGNLELVIAASAAVSPLLLAAVRKLYIVFGGTPALGLAGGTVLRLVLAALVLAIPTLAMGGTLAAATRALAGDERRRSLAVLYGANTLGAVAGAIVATFLFLDLFGTRRTLLVAALLNVLIALVARSTARKADAVVESEPPAAAPTGSVPISVPLVLAASAVVGLVFFLMEITWYRMLGPILGGTVFTFGLILAVALFGIGLGGLIYATRSGKRPATLGGFILTCLFEAAGLAIPWALGDRIAFLAVGLRGTTVLGFAGRVTGWAVVCAIMILPAAIASGIQFPLLVNLVGRGRDHVGRHLGWVYSANTLGAITGSLIGGFVLLPAFGAVDCWRLAVAMLVVLALAATVTHRASWRVRGSSIAVACVIAVLVVAPDGPTAAWRHSGIGAGRATQLENPAAAWGFAARARRVIKWEGEGVESSVALMAENGLAFVVNGKVDGAALSDAGTQMMGGVLGAAIHPGPKRALVIGLGTGETAGWLADAPGIERVDVVELEPKILEVARRCGSVNRHVLDNPKVHVKIGDAREALLVSDDDYDIIFSEPSNPYRAGVASLYTRELYEAVRDRLRPDGLFLQWTQAYEIDGETIGTIYATLGSVFSSTHTWRLARSDLLFVASMSPIRYDAARIAERASSPVLREALDFAWHTDGLEGLMSHYIGGDALAKEIAGRAGTAINTDDHTLIEFAFARTLGAKGLNNIAPLRALAELLHDDRPAISAIDWDRFREQRAFADAIEGDKPAIARAKFTGDVKVRVDARTLYVAGKLGLAASAWTHQPLPPRNHSELLLRAEGLAALGDGVAAEADIEALRVRHPTEADFVLARLRVAQHRWADAATAMIRGLYELRTDPFADAELTKHAIDSTWDIASAAKQTAPGLIAALALPFAIYIGEESRIYALLSIARLDDAALVAALAPMEPDVPWSLEILTARYRVYRELGDPKTQQARADLETFLDGQARALVPEAGESSDDSSTPQPDEPVR